MYAEHAEVSWRAFIFRFAMSQYKVLNGALNVASRRSTLNSTTDEQVAHFLEHGWIKIERAFTQAQADEWTHGLWDRLG